MVQWERGCFERGQLQKSKSKFGSTSLRSFARQEQVPYHRRHDARMKRGVAEARANEERSHQPAVNRSPDEGMGVCSPPTLSTNSTVTLSPNLSLPLSSLSLSGPPAGHSQGPIPSSFHLSIAFHLRTSLVRELKPLAHNESHKTRRLHRP